jgi:hypothetical protein
MIFDPKVLSAKIEPVDTEDQKIQNVWKNGLSRIILAVRNRKLSNDIFISVTEPK